ncbi:MAG TPA: hypothetical protein PLA90_18235, partial [Candidatus Sumerlaeota bacterium]|nr:hypothetical protein [Candidatus Sumerlaeota bacterium]
HLQILGPEGKEVVASDLKLGRYGYEFLWKPQGLVPGHYTIKAKRDTGAFAGQLEAELELTLTE